ncbi:MAG: CopG family ribbon-helix-helix protein [Elstera sp.]
MAQADMRVLTADIPVALADKLQTMAADRDQSPDAIVRQALAAWIDEEELRYRLTLEAIAQVDAGQVVAHSEVVAWIDSLGTDSPLPRPVSRLNLDG